METSTTHQADGGRAKTPFPPGEALKRRSPCGETTLSEFVFGSDAELLNVEPLAGRSSPDADRLPVRQSAKALA
ncbi:hypothetical protein EYF80_017417 [Liparis tanakae]|uniref:Uncharacterized protein n=1 Tax=Liparis tanakae TaxID=230148 RepID=A0A4Z2I370_9TELE|nr:hypothetical protein EYF80_017417 [Liparis tanakae]